MYIMYVIINLSCGFTSCETITHKVEYKTKTACVKEAEEINKIRGRVAHCLPLQKNKYKQKITVEVRK